MARGNLAKERLIDKIIKALPDNYLGVSDKKYYFVEDDGGEQMQIALTLTCPKTSVDFGSSGPPTKKPVDTGMMDFEEEDIPQAPAPDLTAQERENIQKLMEKLGL